MSAFEWMSGFDLVTCIRILRELREQRPLKLNESAALSDFERELQHRQRADRRPVRESMRGNR